MKHTFFVLLIAMINFTGYSQSTSQKNRASQQVVGGTCEGCEAIYESPVPFEKLWYADTLPDFNEPGPKIKISGIVFKNDGKTPAKDVIIYIYHTDQTGRYSQKRIDPGSYQEGPGKRHGYIRGWMKTNESGEYTFYTLRPAAYPQRKDPQHIHVTIKESDKKGYSIDAYQFQDDPLLTRSERSKLKNYGGDGIIQLTFRNGIGEAKRNITLGLNMEDYQVK